MKHKTRVYDGWQNKCPIYPQQHNFWHCSNVYMSVSQKFFNSHLSVKFILNETNSEHHLATNTAATINYKTTPLTN
jgi:hypothetical protein